MAKSQRPVVMDKLSSSGGRKIFKPLMSLYEHVLTHGAKRVFWTMIPALLCNMVTNRSPPSFKYVLMGKFVYVSPSAWMGDPSYYLALTFWCTLSPNEGKPTHTMVPCWKTATLPPRYHCTGCFVPTPITYGPHNHSSYVWVQRTGTTLWHPLIDVQGPPNHSREQCGNGLTTTLSFV
jgi:hypothetical protein